MGFLQSGVVVVGVGVLFDLPPLHVAFLIVEVLLLAAEVQHLLAEEVATLGCAGIEDGVDHWTGDVLG